MGKLAKRHVSLVANVKITQVLNGRRQSIRYTGDKNFERDDFKALLHRMIVKGDEQMLHANTYQHEQVTHEQLQDRLRRVETNALCQKAGLDKRGLVDNAVRRFLATERSLLVAIRRGKASYGAQPAAKGRLFSATGPQ